MSEIRYNVVVSGTALDGFELEQVKQEFARLFALHPAKTDQLFHRGNVVIKKNIAEETANLIISALARIGASAHLLPHAPALETESLPAETPPLDSSLSAQASAADDVALALESDTPLSNTTDNQARRATTATLNPQSAAPGSVHSFAFLGNGFEYFRIWIVNILLTIATLGIYSAWATVRNAQYFYGHTEIAGSRFAYLAKPMDILKGRIIAIIAFMIFSALANLYPIAGAVLALALFLALPWIAVRSLRFDRRMTAWRNIRFNFDGEIWPAAKVFILWPLAGMLTVGLLMPLALYKQNEFIINNTQYGSARFILRPCAKSYFMIFVLAIPVLLVAGTLSWLVSLAFAPLSILAFIVAYLYVLIFISVRTANLIYNNTTLRNGDFGFSHTFTDLSLMKVLALNGLFTLLTLGLYTPWAMVNIAAYKAERLELLAHANLDDFIGAEVEDVSALGDELGNVFDMNIGM